MEEEKQSIHCHTHCEQQETFVCQHVALGLQNKQRVGFFWSTYDPDNPRPDAWCIECEERVRRTNGDWVGESEANLKAKILCGACYDLAKIFHMGGDPWS